MTSYDTVIGALADRGPVRYRGEHQAEARCPAHDDRSPSLSVRYTGQQVLINCFTGCHWRDILTALDLKPSNLFDSKTKSYKGGQRYKPDPAIAERYRARRKMTRMQQVLDDLLHLPDFAQRLCQIIGRRRPELYLIEKRELDAGTNEALLSDPGFRHVAHLIGGAA